MSAACAIVAWHPHLANWASWRRIVVRKAQNKILSADSKRSSVIFSDEFVQNCSLTWAGCFFVDTSFCSAIDEDRGTHSAHVSAPFTRTRLGRVESRRRADPIRPDHVYHVHLAKRVDRIRVDARSALPASVYANPTTGFRPDKPIRLDFIVFA